MINDNIGEAPARLVDTLSLALLALSTCVNVLPAIATLFTVIWAILRVYEMKTVQKRIRRRRIAAARARRLGR